MVAKCDHLFFVSYLEVAICDLKIPSLYKTEKLAILLQIILKKFRIVLMEAKKLKTIAVAESCTGGLLSSTITDVSGSSAYFKMGIVAYSNEAKEKLLGVSFRHCEGAKHPKQSQECDAVSKRVAIAMAKGVRCLAGTDIGVGITGIAGPTGGTKEKPVGLVYIAVATGSKTIAKEFHFKGPRKKIKLQAVKAALTLSL